MQLLVFVTDDGSSAGTSPVLFVKDHPLTALPANPRSLDWRYFATIAKDDRLILDEGPTAQRQLDAAGYFIASRLV